MEIQLCSPGSHGLQERAGAVEIKAKQAGQNWNMLRVFLSLLQGGSGSEGTPCCSCISHSRAAEALRLLPTPRPPACTAVTAGHFHLPAHSHRWPKPPFPHQC